MPTSGLTLDASVLTLISNTQEGIVASIMNIGPVLIFGSLGIWATFLILKKAPGFIKRLARG